MQLHSTHHMSLHYSDNVGELAIYDIVLLRLDPSRRRRSFLEKKRKIEKGPEKSAYEDKRV